MMWERGIRGGLAFITHRQAFANNPYIPDTYQPHLPHLYIKSLDANALYSQALSNPLPTGNFRW
uniref:Uncharacterized protein n=1 Tax=Strigamia maritima TaxID=126957 RepID=T1IGZ4_STRMM